MMIVRPGDPDTALAEAVAAGDFPRINHLIGLRRDLPSGDVRKYTFCPECGDSWAFDGSKWRTCSPCRRMFDGEGARMVDDAYPDWREEAEI